MSEIYVSQERIDKGLWWGRAWSLISGCQPVSPGCAHCWSARQAHVRAGQNNPKIRARYGGLTDDRGRWTGQIRLMRSDLEKPLKVRKPTTWAIWNDLFHHLVPYTFQKEVWTMMASCPQHIFIILTKRSGLMRQNVTALARQGFGVLPNVIGMVTAENQEQADRRIPDLLATPFAVMGLSLEPLLEAIDVRKPIGAGGSVLPLRYLGLDVLFIGCESGPHRRPCELDWVRDLVWQGTEADIAIFVKQLDISGRVSRDMSEWPEDLRIREFPKMEAE